MAKKATTGIDESIYVNQLVAAGMSEDAAKSGVSKLVTFINEKFSGENDETKANIASIKIREMISASRSEKYRVTVVAVGPVYDVNARSRKKAMDTYNDNPGLALSTGAVREVRAGTQNAEQAKDKTWILAIDTKEFWDEAKTKKNFGYNKPFPVRMTRNIVGVSNGTVVSISGNLDLEPGKVYDIFGKVSEPSGVLYANTEPAPRLVETLSTSAFWDEVLNAAKISDIARDIDGVLDEETRGIVMVKGFIHAIGTDKNGGTTARLNNELGSGFTAFARGEQATRSLESAMVGSEAILVGTMRESSDPRYGKSMNCYNAIINPKSGSTVAKALDEMKDFEF
jgi:hypothetical protein